MAKLLAQPGASQARTTGNGQGRQGSQLNDWDILVANIISGQSYHDPLTKLAARLIRGGSNADAAADMLRALMDVSAAPRDERWRARYNDILRAVRTAQEKYGNAPSPAPSIFNAEELDQMTFTPIKYVVPGYVVEGLTLLAGKPKIGKSWLLLHAAVAVASGGFTLGDVHCIEGDVLYCALEDSPRRLQTRMTKLLGIQRRPPRLHFACTMPRLSQGGLDFIKQWIAGAKEPRLVVIDVLAMVRAPARKDQTAYDADYEAVLGLRELARQHGVAIVLVHHLRKADADDAFDTVSGTLGLTGAPDTTIVIRRGANSTTLHARGRDLLEIEKAIRFNPKTCMWSVLGDAGDVRQSDERSTIIVALEEAGSDPLGPNQIAAATGMKAGNIRRLLGKMVSEGVVRKAGYGKYTLQPAA